MPIKGYNPAITIHLEYNLVSSKAQNYVIDLAELHEELQKAILLSQEHYQVSVDRSRMPPPDFKVGDQAFVKAKFFRTTRPSKKLSERYFGPYKIIAQAGPLSWTLRLPDSMQAVHPVFHVSMLESAVSDLIPNRHQTPPPPVIVDGEPEYEISEILDSKLDNRRRACCKGTPFSTTFSDSDGISPPHNSEHIPSLKHLVCPPTPLTTP